ncbi:hypothetical protein [Paraburkholderia sediminicola]|uniref:hypothetical protein n=1 Tax=Paraburkholderia sediminicola TaxID=458836 RepID=UPI0038BBA31A
MEIEAKRRIQEKRKNSVILSSTFSNIVRKPLFFMPSTVSVPAHMNEIARTKSLTFKARDAAGGNSYGQRVRVFVH